MTHLAQVKKMTTETTTAPTTKELIAWLEGLQGVAAFFTLNSTEVKTRGRIQEIINRLKERADAS
jgi:hypothetical protein